MSIQIFENSRYSYKTIKAEGQVYRIPRKVILKQTDFTDNITVRLAAGDRLDSLSYALYGTTDFYWVIAEFNNLKYFAEDLSNMETLIAPSRETLFSVILPKIALFT